MPAKSGLIARIVAHLREHPGLTGAELGAALDFDHLTGTLTYARKTGAIFAAGPKHWYRYYATRGEAEAMHADLVAQARDHVVERQRVEHRKGNLKRRAQRHAAGVKPVNTRQAELASITLPPGVVIHPDVRVTVAKPIPDRFAPSPGWERAITADYFLRRHGVPIPDVVRGKPVYAPLFERMKDDSMVELPVMVARNFMCWARKNRPGRLVIRKLGPDRCGVWKVKAAKK